MKFQNKVVVVTGAGSGIGEATATLFAKEGAHVVIVDIDEEKANSTADICKQLDKEALVIIADVSKIEDNEKIIKKTIDKFGRLDVLVNNAGIARQGSILDGKIMGTYDLVMNTNLRSIVVLITLAVPHLNKTKGCIVNTSSVVSTAVRCGASVGAYCVSKAGVDAFTRASAMELATVGIRVNAVNPGPVYTNILANSGIPGTWEDYKKLTALKKASDPEEVADFIMYLASDKAKSMTGGCYTIDNGMDLV